MVVNVSDDIIVNGVYDASKTSVPGTSLVAPGQTAKGGVNLAAFHPSHRTAKGAA
jgi:hypothetical protein